MASGSVSEMYSETVYAAPKLASFDVTVRKSFMRMRLLISQLQVLTSTEY